MIDTHQAHSMERGVLGTHQNRGKTPLFLGGSLEINMRGRVCLMSVHTKNIVVVSIDVIKVFCIDVRLLEHVWRSF